MSSTDSKRNDGKPSRAHHVIATPGIPGGLQLPSLPGALCKGQDPSAWFPAAIAGRPSERETAAGKARCYPCPARLQCLTWALRLPEPEGIWGGTTPDERTAMRRASKRHRDTAST